MIPPGNLSWIRLAADLDNAKAFIDAMMDEEPPVKAAE
jgi:hypothetical protein